jgi:cytoskeleton protein RodZ
MAKRDPEPDPVDEELIQPGLPTVGEQLRTAREAKGVSLEDVAAQTRIPQRHLASIETADWDSLPAPTYTIGFAKSYASVVGLDRTEIGNQLREEMGGQRFASSSADVFEPADPRRTMPKGLVIGAILAVVVLIALMSWLNKRSLEGPEPQSNAPSADTSAPAPGANNAPAVSAAPAQGAVVLTAVAPAWIQVTDQGKKLFAGMLKPGQKYAVPATATAPMLRAGKPEALSISVGGAAAPPVGPAGKVATVSLAPAALMKGPASATQASQPAAAQSRRAQTPASTAPPAAPQAADAEPAGNTTE